jgi:Na+/melibiose symporter-like transporter
VEKGAVGLSQFAFVAVLVSLSTMNTVYVRTFGADPTAVGIADGATVLFDIANSPFIGFGSDSGVFNVGPFRQVAKWGRRAPLMLLGVPVSMVGSFCSFAGPVLLSLEGGLLVAWTLACRLVLTVGMGGLVFIAHKSAFPEVFTSKAERLEVANGMGIAYGLGLFVGLPLTALSLHPGEGDERQRTFILLGGVVSGLWLLALPWGFSCGGP